MLRIHLLGRFALFLDNEPLALASRPAQSLLAWLVLHPGVDHRREQMAGMLWPDAGEENALSNLRHVLWHLRRIVPAEFVVSDRMVMRWTKEGEWRSDVTDLTATALTAASADELIPALQAYGGELLPGFYDDWVTLERERLAALYADRVARLLELLLAEARWREAIDWAEKWIAQGQTPEPAYRALIQAHASLGNSAAALTAYERCIDALDRELGVPPSAETAALAASIRNPPFTPSTGSGHPIPNLPAPTTPLIGRENELAALALLLADPAHRLVTIVGPGGMGKSRLALAAAQAQVDHFTDGVWFVPLATVDRAEAVAATIAASLSAPSGTADGRSPLFAFLKEKKILLLLDNFEHLLGAVDFLAELLQYAPGLKLLLTSQERLNLREESLYPLAGLASPAGNGAVTPALQLFEQTARRVQPHFRLTDEWSQAVAICQAVDGMPLAIEMAAGWVQVMSCAEIAAEIQRSAEFLSTTARNVPARHRSLRALFERSWALLSSQEQELLARLSVFQGGFTRQAAAVVAGAPPIQLVALQDHSFVQRESAHRFNMHGLLQRFVAEKLTAQSDLEEEAHSRHAAYYADWVAQAGWELQPGEPETAAALEEETANIQAAWRWAVQTKDASLVQRMMRWLVDFYRRQGDHSGGRKIFIEAIHAFRDREREDPALLGALLLQRGKCVVRLALEERSAGLEEAITLLRAANPPAPLDLAQALVMLGKTDGYLGRNPEGAELMSEALALMHTAGNQRGVGATLRDWGVLEMGWGRLREAQRFLEESVQVLEGYDHKSQVQSNFLLGTTLMMRGHYQRSRELLRGALPFFVEWKENFLAAVTLRNLGDLYTATGDFAEARRSFTEAYARLEPYGLAYEITGAMCLSVGALARLTDDPNAERILLDGLASDRQVGFRQRIATSLHHLARLRYEQKEYTGSLDLLDEALAIAREIDFRYATAVALAQRGHSLLALQQEEPARAAYAEALTIARSEGIDRAACDALTGIAQRIARKGEASEAVALLAFAEHCPASEWETRRRAAQILAQLQELLPAAAFHTAQEQGQARVLPELTAELVALLA